MGSPAAHISPILNRPGHHSLGTSHPYHGTTHPSHLPLGQGFTCHLTCDTDTLIISDDLPIPAAMGDNMKKTMTLNSVYTPASLVKDTSHVSSALYIRNFKDPLPGTNTSRTIVCQESPSLGSNSVSITTPACKHSSGYLPIASGYFKEIAASHVNTSDASAALPLISGSSSGSALWTQPGSHCHWDADRSLLIAPMKVLCLMSHVAAGVGKTSLMFRPSVSRVGVR